MENKEKPNYYAVLTANVRYDKRLRDKAKLLFAEITALSNREGSCYASNGYFADLYGVSTTTISTLISELENYCYIKVEINHSKGNERKIYIIADGGIKENLNTSLKNFKDPSLKNFKDNNININNKDNNSENKTKTDKKTSATKMQTYSEHYANLKAKEQYYMQIALKYGIDLNTQQWEQVMQKFISLNAEKKASVFDFKKHFENWLKSDYGEKEKEKAIAAEKEKEKDIKQRNKHQL